jgi:pimeloyl-ACP methyl ester carboxylesterase
MEREPLVLIHGFSGTPVMWEPIADRLAEHHELLIPTLAGHCGGAGLADGVECSVAAVADALEADMDAAGLETAHICGNSLGGWLALELAVRGRARSVVAIAPAGGWEPGSREEKRLRRYFRRLHRIVRMSGKRAEPLTRRPGMRKLAMRDMCVHGDRLTAAQAAAMVRGSYECAIWTDLLEAIERDGPPQAFEGIDCPARIVWGTKDRIIPHGRYAQRLRDLVPTADYVELEGVGHVPMVDDPERVARTILEVTARTAVPV